MFEISPSPFDVQLVAFRIPIRIHWSFWLISILLGWDPDHFERVFLWVVCGFFSVLVHELGHALTAEKFGWPTHIVLYYGGGLAISDRYRNNTPWRGVVVSFMGPGAGFLFLALVVAVQFVLMTQNIRINQHVLIALYYLQLMNFFYSVFNLIPVLPLDGGHICASVCQMLGVRDALGMTLKIGAVVAGLATYYFFVVMDQQLAGMMMLMLCVQSIGALQSRR
jgi:stage IV sporulation protein FB